MPIETLLARVADEVTDLHVGVLARLAHNLREEGWTCGDPVVVDYLRAGDVPERVLGLALVVASSDMVPATPSSELRSFVDFLTWASAAHGITFEFERDGHRVGRIADGAASRVLLIGLVEAW